MKTYECLNTVGKITEELDWAKELEKIEHLGALAAITEELYFSIHAK